MFGHIYNINTYPPSMLDTYAFSQLRFFSMVNYMFSWTEEILQKAKDHVASVAAEMSGVPVDEIHDAKGANSVQQERPLHYPFKLPIQYIAANSVHPLSAVVVQDLELVQTVSSASDTTKQSAQSAQSAQSTSHSMYEHLFQPTHPFGQAMIHEWKQQFTTDTQYLKDTQQVIQELQPMDYTVNHTQLMQIWKDTKQDASFLEKYCYVEWDLLRSFNQSSAFLQVLSITNMMSPAISLVLPLLFLIFPLVILKLRGIPITFSMYIDVLKEIAKHHFIGKTLTNLASISWEKMVYILITFGLYLYQVYQNTIACYRFYRNIHKINDQLCGMRDYLGQSILNMERFIADHRLKPSYSAFCRDMAKHCAILHQICADLGSVCPVHRFITKLGSVGYLLKCYYELHSNPVYEESIRYSFGLEGFLDNLRGVKMHIENGHVAMATYDHQSACTFNAQYYPPYFGQDHVKNTCTLDRKMIITGPNASGKTTLLKTTTINVIFSQQVGCGFYGSCMLNPYTHIHSYLNIPDTSERDSLFQAESRRCKEILDVIRDSQDIPGTRHYCIFDELYSGTNPEEATKSAYALLKYLTQYTHVDFILTTHYVSLCKKLKKCKEIRNYKMDVEVNDQGEIRYTYRIKPGISKIQGAIRILEDMNYPTEILQEVRVVKDRSNKKKKEMAKMDDL